MMPEKSNILENKPDVDEPLRGTLRGPFKIYRRLFIAADTPSQQNNDLDDNHQYPKPQKPAAPSSRPGDHGHTIHGKEEAKRNNIHQDHQSHNNDDESHSVRAATSNI